MNKKIKEAPWHETFYLFFIDLAEPFVEFVGKFGTLDDVLIWIGSDKWYSEDEINEWWGIVCEKGWG